MEMIKKYCKVETNGMGEKFKRMSSIPRAQPPKESNATVVCRKPQYKRVLALGGGFDNNGPTKGKPEKIGHRLASIDPTQGASLDYLPFRLDELRHCPECGLTQVFDDTVRLDQCS